MSNTNLINRLAQRSEVKQIGDAKKFKKIGEVWYYEASKSLAPTFVINLLPEAKIVVIGYPNTHISSKLKFQIRIRLGQASHGKINLKKIGFLSEDKDYSFGGRWNTMSNSRSKTSICSIEQVERAINEHIML